MANQLFLVERYDDTGIPGRLPPLPPPPAQVLLHCAVRVPADDVVLALVEASAEDADEQAVCRALTSAGWRVDRIIAATWIHPHEKGTS